MTSRPSWWTNDDWETPPRFVRRIERTFGKFEIDPCCKIETAKAPRLFALKDNGLRQTWDGRTFFNPPYSNPYPWVRKAARQTMRGFCPLAVGLLPTCFDTAWFHEWVLPYAELHFIRGRISFLGWEGTPIGSPRNPNFLAVYRADVDVAKGPRVYTLTTFDNTGRLILTGDATRRA